MTDTAFDMIAHVIQLSVAPVFLLVAIGSFLNVVTQRLGRVVDRARYLEDRIDNNPGALDVHQNELASLSKRMSYAQWSINLCAAAALMVAVDVALLFLAGLADYDASLPAAILFMLAMFGIIGGLGAFLAEISVATRTLRVKAELLAKK
jgi:hypothetical protein